MIRFELMHGGRLICSVESRDRELALASAVKQARYYSEHGTDTELFEVVNLLGGSRVKIEQKETNR